MLLELWRKNEWATPGVTGRAMTQLAGERRLAPSLRAYASMFAAAEHAGYRRNPDYNSEDQEGIAKTQASIRRGRRMSAATVSSAGSVNP